MLIILNNTNICISVSMSLTQLINFDTDKSTSSLCMAKLSFYMHLYRVSNIVSYHRYLCQNYGNSGYDTKMIRLDFYNIQNIIFIQPLFIYQGKHKTFEITKYSSKRDEITTTSPAHMPSFRIHLIID